MVSSAAYPDVPTRLLSLLLPRPLDSCCTGQSVSEAMASTTLSSLLIDVEAARDRCPAPARQGRRSIRPIFPAAYSDSI